MNNCSQAHFISLYNDKHRPKFNDQLFQRDNMEIAEQIKKVVLSCQRDQTFTIKVLNFEIIEDYKKINDILYNEYENLYRDKKKKKDNTYAYVNLKQSDIMLAVVEYYIAIGGHSDIIKVLIEIPRIVNKYYFRISGNLYSAMYQIVETTYNNNQSTSFTKPRVTFRPMFQPIKIFRNHYDLEDADGNIIKDVVFYVSRIFEKSFSALKYILAKLGLYGAYEFMGINCIQITNSHPNNCNFYTFMKNDIYISVPRILFDQESIIQTFVFTLCQTIERTKDITIEKLFQRDFWLQSLGSEFKYETVEKGLSLLDSLESIYDMDTMEQIRLPQEQKASVYHILRWMLREYTQLNVRYNLDISTKRIRIAPYIASLYGMKLTKGIYRIAHAGKKATLDTIKQAIKTQPDFLLGAITKCSLVNYRNLVNDLDSMIALKYSFKGISGMGEKNVKSVPAIQRGVDPSHLKRLDLDSSPKSDPGMSGMLCPLGDIYDGSFSDYQEPNEWEDNFKQTMDEYKKMIGIKEVIEFKSKVLGVSDKLAEEHINQCIDISANLIQPIEFIVKDNTETEPLSINIPLEEGGFITYEQ